MKTVARPLVRINQVFISVSILLALGLNQMWLIIVPMLVNLSALLFNYHPVMKLGKRLLRDDLSLYAQEDVADLRFNQTIVVSLLSAGLLALFFNQGLIAIVMSVMVLIACLVAIMGFCVGCFIRYHLNLWIYRVQTKQK